VKCRNALCIKYNEEFSSITVLKLQKFYGWILHARFPQSAACCVIIWSFIHFVYMMLAVVACGSNKRFRLVDIGLLVVGDKQRNRQKVGSLEHFHPHHPWGFFPQPLI
jgi:hypothetical protein